MAPRWRIAAFGSAGTLVLAGVACAVLVPGLTGELLTFVLIAAGLAGALLLVFLEVGLGEERELAREARRRRRRTLRALGERRRGRLARRPRRPD